jgi:hypothetical protein
MPSRHCKGCVVAVLSLEQSSRLYFVRWCCMVLRWCNCMQRRLLRTQWRQDVDSDHAADSQHISADVL